MPGAEPGVLEDLFPIVRHLVEHQMAEGALADPAVQFWIRPRNALCGDMVLAGRAPNGMLHVLLADAGPDGLAAYLSLLPIIAPFRRMTEKGFSPAAIARELNLKVLQTLPAKRSIAVLLAAVDHREGVVSVWNGGMPAAFMLDGFGRHFKQFPLRHAPLGTLNDAAFDERVEQHSFSRGEQLVMVSDGLLSASDPDGRPFGATGLSNSLAGLPRSQRRAEVIASVESHLAGQPSADDLTLVLVDCEKGASRPAIPQADGVRVHRPGNWSFVLQLDANELRHLDVVPMLLGITSQFPLTQGRSGELFVILSELFNNALDHGVLRLDSQLKLSPDGMESWLRLREERLAGLQQGEVCLRVEQRVAAGSCRLQIACRDSGPGFDLSAMLSCSEARLASASADALPFGRGLALMKRIAPDIEISGQGSEVTVSLQLEQGH